MVYCQELHKNTVPGNRKMCVPGSSHLSMGTKHVRSAIKGRSDYCQERAFSFCQELHKNTVAGNRKNAVAGNRVFPVVEILFSILDHFDSGSFPKTIKSVLGIGEVFCLCSFRAKLSDV